MEPLRIGCSGWSYRDWREGLYAGVPQRRWLERYAEAFDTVEVNATFYRLPRRSTIEAWVEQTPDGFSFAVKGSRYLTHIRRLTDTDTGLKRFWEPLESLREADRLGPVLWQLPENFERDDAVLDGFLAALPGGARHCFEFRHPSWFAAPVRRILESHEASLVIGDDARRELPAAGPLGPLAYLRLHYGARGRRGNYSESELDTWRRRISGWRSRRPVFVYLNNDWEGFAPADAAYLKRSFD
ncbi:MAG TPA: DUF72 domain-containing protein [Solirubrobacterales bacterium]|jgi:uncharacterized protein YecE (DUF72 family)|nr:DUF72 domain-containing protein [Solirubrobacterales bacterium]